MDAVHKKILKLQEQQAALHQTIVQLEEQRHHEFTQIIRLLPHHQLDPVTLLGGLLHVCQEAKNMPATAEVWRQAGQQFLKKKRTSSRMVQNSQQTCIKSTTSASATTTVNTSHRAI